MKPCERIRQQALAVVALAPGERELKEAWEHARTCAGCAQALQAAEGMLALVDAELAPSPPSAEALLRAKRAIELELDRQPARSLQAARVAAALATIGAGAALAGPWAHHHHHLDASSVALGAGAAITAVALAWLGVGRRAAGAAFAACAVSLVVAALASTSLGASIASPSSSSPRPGRWLRSPRRVGFPRRPRAGPRPRSPRPGRWRGRPRCISLARSDLRPLTCSCSTWAE